VFWTFGVDLQSTLN